MNYFSFLKSEEENKASYRDLVKKFHPDMPGGNADKFRAIQNEYEFYTKRLKENPSGEQKEAFDHIFSGMNFKDKTYDELEVFYIKNKSVIDEAINRFIFKNKANRNMDQELVRFGFALGKSVLDLFKIT